MSNYRFWTEEENQKFKNKRHESWGDFAKRELPHRTGVACMKHARKYLGFGPNNYSPRKYTFNENAFKELTPESCYWAGFIATDGNLLDRRRQSGKENGYYILGIELSQDDEDHLEKFVKYMQYTGTITKITRRTPSGKIKTYPSLKIAIGRSRVSDDLYKHFNITKRKTYTLKPPNIKDKFLLLCYIAGAIDGDGSICCRKTKYNYNSSIRLFSGSPDYSEWFNDVIHEFTEGLEVRTTKSTNNKKIYKNGNVHHISLSGQKALALVDAVRQLPIPRLKRKWDKPEMLSFIEDRKDTHPDNFLDLNDLNLII